MPYVTVIFFASLAMCTLFIGTPQMLQDNSRLDTDFPAGQVLGVEDIAPQRQFADLFKENFRLPQMTDTHDPIPYPRSEMSSFECENVVAFVIDPKNGVELYNEQADKQVPIASITKLMTALVFLDNNPGWDREYRVLASDQINGGRVYVFSGDRVTAGDLFNLSLVASDNAATRALVRSTGLELDEFVVLMNTKARDMGLENTSFVDPIGIGAGNVSTARSVAELLNTALASKHIADTLSRANYVLTTANGKVRTAHSTNKILKEYPKEEAILIGGKTGHTELAGYCLATKFKDEHENEIISVVLGEGSSPRRFAIINNMLDWTLENYEWR
ncbi:D-alanyl-D-alanine carboxypeptidase [Candidatus Parcubacteria bacterium]|nr:D-alanyl-D-alanine carboxypeptidase [Candidatus Parcubacteria bacterium]